MLQLLIFVIASAGLVYVSRASVRRPRTHGFYRFWAWEAILALLLLNAPVWFRDPFSRHQLVAWTLLVIAIIPLVLSVHLLRQARRAAQARPDAALFNFEKTSELVTVGVYRYIRHPMYSSLLFLAWGAFSKAPSWPGIVLALIATGFLVATAKIEERENIRFFGPIYETYVKRTRMFIPFVF